MDSQTIGRSLWVGIFLLSAAYSPAVAGVITFDEAPPTNPLIPIILSNTPLVGPIPGAPATITGNNAGTLGGNSNGNPGAWFLEGTNGPQFLGYNGFSSTGNSVPKGDTLTFTISGIDHVSIDFSKADFTPDGKIAFRAFDSSHQEIGSSAGFLTDTNVWTTLSITATGIASVSWLETPTTTMSAFEPFMAYGVDNVQFAIAAVPELSTWGMMLLGFVAAGFAGNRKRLQLAA
jgi:hypothetical protein